MPEAPNGKSPLPSSSGRDSLRLTPSEWLLLLVLAAVQFTHIVDFMIIMPLGSHFINAPAASEQSAPAGGEGYVGASGYGSAGPASHAAGNLHMTPEQFGLVVSAYTLAAGLASLLAFFFLDRFDRKNALVGLFAGFTVGTLLCAFAPTYELLVAARVVAGAFGGVCAANVLAIIGDAFPDSRRGTATGVVMSAFSVASIAGVPLGLYLAELSGTWQAPFAVLGTLCGGVLVLAACVLPPLRGHLGRRHPSAAEVLAVAVDPNHLRAFALMASLVGSSFLVVPYLATFMVSNVGVTESHLKYIYFFGGATTLLTLTWIGRVADRRGKLPVFRVFALGTTVPLFLITVLPYGTPLALVLAVTTLLFVVTSGRMVPGMALITNSSTPRVRGSFMSLNSAVQQFGAGLAAWLGGYLLHKGEDGRLTGYPLVGVLGCLCAVASVYLASHLRPVLGGADAPDTGVVHPADEDEMPEAAGEIASHFHARPPSGLNEGVRP